jgi:Protein of unknown function (DUF4239)
LANDRKQSYRGPITLEELKLSPEKFALCVAVGILVAGVIGLSLQRFLPERHTTGPARDMIGAVAGLLTLLCALVTGLLIWTAYGVYAGQNQAIETLASKVLQLDLALEDYGPEAKPARLALRDRVGKTVDQVWSANDTDANFAANNFSAAIETMRDPEKALGGLQASTDVQRQALANAVADIQAIAASRLQMAFALTAPVSYPLLLTVVAWVACLFCGFGLMSRANAMSITAMVVGAVAVASAVWLILDLSGPYSGVFRVSPAPLEQVLAVMGKE